MRIIVLEGLHDTGKTSTLNILYYDILASGGVFNSRTVVGGDPNDFTSEGTFRGEKVAIYTMGDMSAVIRKVVYEFDKKNIDLLICALRNDSNMSWANSAINHFPNKRHIKTFGKTPDTRLAVNRADASILFSLI